MKKTKRKSFKKNFFKKKSFIVEKCRNGAEMV